jgi:pyruvate dehydrogenase E1 component alpha subunit
MPIKKVYEGSVDYLQVLDEKGNVDRKLEPKLTPDLLKKMFELMILTRAYDDKSVKLQRQGRMGTYAPILGQEAVGVGAAFALRKEDWALPTYRDTQVYIAKGVPLEKIFMYWKGIEEGMNFPEGTNCFPFAIPIATHLPHAVGMAFALKRANKKQVMLTMVGDGGTSQGDFHESMNFAGVWQVPLVVIIVNNQWAISVPRSEQSHSKTLAQKGISYGIPCVQVDGNDALAVYKAVSDAAENAREGKGPTLIEAMTYRMSMHTTADDPTKYRSDKEVEGWRAKDPIDRFRKYLQKKKLWTKDYEAKALERFAKEIDEAVAAMEAYKGDPHDMFRYVWFEVTDNLKEQMAEMDRSYAAGDKA